MLINYKTRDIAKPWRR